MSTQPQASSEKRLAQLEQLVKLGKQFGVSFEQVRAQQTALKSALTIEDLQKLIQSPKPEHQSVATGFLEFWWKLLQPKVEASKVKTPPTNIALVQNMPKASPPSGQALKGKLDQITQWGKQSGVTLKQAGDCLNKTITEADLQKWVDSEDEKCHRAAALILDTWKDLISAKVDEMQRLKGASPKQESPPTGLKLVQNSTAEDLGGLQPWEQCILDSHNTWRAKYSRFPRKLKPSLTYDRTLAGHAQLWADYLAKNDQYKHNANTTVSGFTGPVGENLSREGWMGTSRSKRQLLESAVDGWGNEDKFYDFVKHESKTGDMVGHFTQLIWRNTKKVGCGYALIQRPGGWTYCYIVCVYHPSGNYTGQYPDNID
jgi:pathogenesis-related protein 1